MKFNNFSNYQKILDVYHNQNAFFISVYFLIASSPLEISQQVKNESGQPSSIARTLTNMGIFNPNIVPTISINQITKLKSYWLGDLEAINSANNVFFKMIYLSLKRFF